MCRFSVGHNRLVMSLDLVGLSQLSVSLTMFADLFGQLAMSAYLTRLVVSLGLRLTRRLGFKMFCGCVT